MSSLKKTMFRAALVFLYFPLSFCVIGWTAYQMRAPSPLEGRYLFKEVFSHYGHPLNPEFLGIHLPALVFCLAVLVLLTSLAGSPRPLLTKVQVRILLLVPLVLVTLIVHIFHGTWNAPFAQIFPSWKVVFRDMFLYIDVHLILLYLLTYLPFIWKPSSGKRPVISPPPLL